MPAGSELLTASYTMDMWKDGGRQAVAAEIPSLGLDVRQILHC